MRRDLVREAQPIVAAPPSGSRLASSSARRRPTLAAPTPWPAGSSTPGSMDDRSTTLRRPRRTGRGVKRPKTAERRGPVDGASVALLFNGALRRSSVGLDVDFSDRDQVDAHGRELRRRRNLRPLWPTTVQVVLSGPRRAPGGVRWPEQRLDRGSPTAAPGSRRRRSPSCRSAIRPSDGYCGESLGGPRHPCGHCSRRPQAAGRLSPASTLKLPSRMHSACGKGAGWGGRLRLRGDDGAPRRPRVDLTEALRAFTPQSAGAEIVAGLLRRPRPGDGRHQLPGSGRRAPGGRRATDRVVQGDARTQRRRASGFDAITVFRPRTGGYRVAEILEDGRRFLRRGVLAGGGRRAGAGRGAGDRRAAGRGVRVGSGLREHVGGPRGGSGRVRRGVRGGADV